MRGRRARFPSRGRRDPDAERLPRRARDDGAESVVEDHAVLVLDVIQRAEADGTLVSKRATRRASTEKALRRRGR